jgi:hypothetical protein
MAKSTRHADRYIPDLVAVFKRFDDVLYATTIPDPGGRRVLLFEGALMLSDEAERLTSVTSAIEWSIMAQYAKPLSDAEERQAAAAGCRPGSRMLRPTLENADLLAVCRGAFRITAWKRGTNLVVGMLPGAEPQRWQQDDILPADDLAAWEAAKRMLAVVKAPPPKSPNYTVLKARQYIIDNPGKKGHTIATYVKVGERHFYSRIVPELKALGVTGSRRTGYLPPPRPLPT